MTKLSKIFIWSVVFVVAIFGLVNFSQARTWTQSGTTGLGLATNLNFYGFVTLGNSLFTGTYNLTGARSFTSSDGLNWVSVNTDGFGDANNIAYDGYTFYNNYLYYCTRNTAPVGTGTEVWRATTSGVLSAVQVNNDGFGAGNLNADCHFLIDFKGTLYSGTENNTNGGEVYAYTNTAPNWVQVNTSGFGAATNTILYTAEVFNNYLYVGTYNATTGGQLWRTADGLNWSQVISNGFGKVTNSTIVSLESFNNYLYAGVANTAGAEIWRSSDGLNWTQTTFSSANDISIQKFYVVGDLMFLGTINTSNGAAIFETRDGITWTQNNVNGFGSGGIAGNIAIRDFGLFGDYLYTGAFSGLGGSIWRADITAPTVTTSPNNKASRKKIKVTLSSDDSAGSIYYTTNGSTPTISSTQYSKTLTFKKTTVLKFIGVDTEGNVSDVSTKYFIVTDSPYLYKANYELREKNGTIKFYRISTGKYGKKFKPFSSGLKYFGVADVDQDNSAEIVATNGSEIKVYNSKRKLESKINVANDYMVFGDIDNSKKEKGLFAKNKTLKIYNKTSLVKAFNFSEDIRALAVGRVFKYNQPLIIVGFADKINFYQYKNGGLVLKKTKTLKYSKLLAYDLDTNGIDNIMYSSGKRVYILNKKLKKKFSFKAGGSFLSVADVNDDYLLEVLASNGKKLRTYSNEGVLLTSKKDTGKWVGGRF